MYAKLCDIEVLPNYIKEVAVGDILTVQALITNPLDWHHFYEKVSTIKIGDRTDFTVVTQEGERVIGFGNIVEVDKWSNRGQYGFKIKISVKKSDIPLFLVGYHCLGYIFTKFTPCKRGYCFIKILGHKRLYHEITPAN